MPPSIQPDPNDPTAYQIGARKLAPGGMLAGNPYSPGAIDFTSGALNPIGSFQPQKAPAIVDLPGELSEDDAPAPGSAAAVAAGARPSVPAYSDPVARALMGDKAPLMPGTPMPGGVTPSAAGPAPAADIAAPKTDYKSTIGRALMAFGNGMRDTPAGAAFSPLGGAIAGGLGGAGQTYQDALNRRISMLQPWINAQKEALSESAKMAVDEPYRSNKESEDFARQGQLATLKSNLATSAAAASVGSLDASTQNVILKQATKDADATGEDRGSDKWNNAYQVSAQRQAQTVKTMGNVGAPKPAPAAGGKPPLTSFVQ
jgi:hypothetical protein